MKIEIRRGDHYSNNHLHTDKPMHIVGHPYRISYSSTSPSAQVDGLLSENIHNPVCC